MWKLSQFKRPSRGMLAKMFWVGTVAAAGVVAFFWGLNSGRSQGPAPAQPQAGPRPIQLQPLEGGDYDKRVVAYVTFGGQQYPITRQELGEYLIERFGAQRLDFLINRKIIEVTCAQNGIQVSDAEIAQQYADDLKGFGVDEKQFVNVLLKRRGQTLYEWKEDVIRPRLLMSKLVRNRVVVTEDDIHKAFEARYGDKVQCRMIVLAKEQGRNAYTIWQEVQNSEELFTKWASQSVIPEIAAKKGEVPPIHRFFPNKEIEKAAFELENGKVSGPIDMEDSTKVILKRDRLIPRDNTAKIDEMRPRLRDQVFEVKLAGEIPVVFQQLRTQADPRIFLKHQETMQEMERSARELLPKHLQPTGN
jgi:hypothetical protein